MPQIMGVIFWICALVTVAANQPEDDLGREGTDPSCAANTRSSGGLTAPALRGELIEDEGRDRHRAGLAALRRTDSVGHAELNSIL